MFVFVNFSDETVKNVHQKKRSSCFDREKHSFGSTASQGNPLLSNECFAHALTKLKTKQMSKKEKSSFHFIYETEIICN